jgi:hypothetical protein
MTTMQRLRALGIPWGVRIVVCVLEVLVLAAAPGCKERNTAPRGDTGVRVGNAAGDIGRAAAKIDVERGQIERKAPDTKPHTDAIGTQTDELRAIQARLDAARSQIKDQEKSLAAALGKVEGLERKVRALEADRNSLLSRLLAGLAVLAVVGAAVCMFALKDLRLAAGCGFLFVVAISAQFLLAWAIWFAGGLALLIVGVIVWVVFVQRKGLAEVVEFAEKIKPITDPVTIEAIGRRQSPATRRIVAAVRTKLQGAA